MEKRCDKQRVDVGPIRKHTLMVSYMIGNIFGIFKLDDYIQKPQPPYADRTSRSKEQLDIEIANQRRHLCFLTSERNRCVAAVSCPTEILTEVFCHVMRLIIEDLVYIFSDNTVEQNLSDQLAVSHVCHHWRSVVLRSQAYWRYQPIGENGLLWFPEMVQRAGKQPLYLWMNIERRRPWGIHSQRYFSLTLLCARSLYIPIPYDSHSNNASSIIKAIPRSLPVLESLVLLTGEIKDRPLGIHDFNGFPQLRTLAVIGFAWSWESLSLPSTMVHLTLRGPVDQIWGERSRETLMQLTNLRTLKIIDTSPPEYDAGSNLDSFPRTPTIKMPHLQHLRVAADPLSATTFIQQFELSHDTSVSVHCTYLRTSDRDEIDFAQLRCLLNWINLYLRGLNKAGTEICSLQIEEDTVSTENMSLILRFWTSRFPPPHSQNWSIGITRPQLKIRFENHVADDDFTLDEDDSPDQLRDYLKKIIPWFHLTGIRHLRADKLNVVEKPGRVFDALPKVEVLSLSGVGVAALLGGLMPRKRSSKRSRLPALRTLTVRDADDLQDQDITELVDSRLRCGQPLQDLRIIRCASIQAASIEQLRQKVPHVEWEIEEEN